jgi:hypothetical protein
MPLKPYTCRRCRTPRASWEIFEAGRFGRPKLYCLGCVPRWVRLSMWLRGVE